MLSSAQAAAFFRERDNFTILTHRRPDGDTLGSSALLCMGLRQLGKNAAILENPEVTPKYAGLVRGLCKQTIPPEDIVVSVDVASENMLPAGFGGRPIALRIDHHGTSSSFTEFELVKPDCAACGEVVLEVLEELGVQLDIPMAGALYTAISTDTGCFRYANTTANTFLAAAKCAAAGADIFSINQALFETNSLARLRLQGWLVEHALFLQEGQIVICALPKQTEQELGLTEDDMENISGFPRSIEGVKIAATIRQEGEDRVKISVRAVPGYDAGEICAHFGGGGHKGAAGASIQMTMDQAVQALKGVMPAV